MESKAAKFIKAFSTNPQINQLATNAQAFHEITTCYLTLLKHLGKESKDDQENLDLLTWLLTGKYINSKKINYVLEGSHFDELVQFLSLPNIQTKLQDYVKSLAANAKAPECKRQYKQIKVLGGGTYGKVYLVQDQSNNTYAMKVLEDIKMGTRDQYFLRILDNQLVDGAKMTPKFIDSYICGKVLNIIMDVYNGDMQALGKANAISKLGNDTYLLYTREHLLRMFRIATRLGQLGIFHGDLKPNQYLYNDTNIVVTDFGFAGGSITTSGRAQYQYIAEEGWTGEAKKALRCPDAFSPLKSADLTYENVLQLELYMIIYHPVFVYDASSNSIRRFIGIKGLDRRDGRCKGYGDNYSKAVAGVIKSGEPTLEFELGEITP